MINMRSLFLALCSALRLVSPASTLLRRKHILTQHISVLWSWLRSPHKKMRSQFRSQVSVYKIARQTVNAGVSENVIE